MLDIWKFFGCFDFMGKLLEVRVGGMSLFLIYITLLFLGACLWLAWSAAARPRQWLAEFRQPSLYIALAVSALFFFFNRNDLASAYTYEVKNLADAAEAARSGCWAHLLGVGRIVPLIFTAALSLANLQALTAGLCLFIGLFYALWERILREVFGFRRELTIPVALLMALLQLKLRYLFSAYFIFSLFFSALFLYRFLLLLKDGRRELTFLQLAQPVFLILLASLFRQESVTLFLVYFTGLLFTGKASLKKGALVLAAGGALYLPFLYHDWTREESQFMLRRWEQPVAELFYDAEPRDIPREWFREKQHLTNVAHTIRQGRLFRDLSRQEFLDAVKAGNAAPAPSLANVWYNLKYRSTPFLLMTAGWFVFFLAALPTWRRPPGETGCLAALSAYILSVFFIFHLSSLATGIWASYYHLLPAYIAFCLPVARNIRERARAS